MHERWLIVAMTLLSPCQFPEHPYGNLLEKLVLFRHASNNSLVPLQEKENIKDGEIIEIVLSGTVSPPEVLVDALSDSRHVCIYSRNVGMLSLLVCVAASGPVHGGMWRGLVLWQ